MTGRVPTIKKEKGSQIDIIKERKEIVVLQIRSVK